MGFIQTTPKFEYFRENPSSWATLFSQFRSSGVQRLLLPIDWAAHEPTRGMRDFSRSSKLRIERVLGCAEEAGIGVTVSTGFQDFFRSTPIWARSSWETSALLPSSLIYRRPLGSELTSIASLSDFEFKSAWFGFLTELFSILSLYVQPEGPVADIEVDLSLFDRDQGMLRSHRFPEVLARRYGGIDSLNLRYQSSFRSFESVCSSQGFRLLLDKRPWHAVYDYRWVRAELLRELSTEILQLAESLAESLHNRVRIRTVAETSLPIAPSPEPLSVLVDSVFIEPIAEQSSSPFTVSAFASCPDGMVHAQASIALRIWEVLSSDAQENGVPIHLMPIQTVRPEMLSSPSIVVICGRYLCRNWVDALAAYVQNGGNAIFPFGLPQYDECLKALVWKGPPADSLNLDEIRVNRLDNGKGSIWMPAPAPVFGQDFFTSIQQLGHLVSRARHN